MIGCVLLSGEPASGKSTIMRSFLTMLHERPTFFKVGLVSGFHYTIARTTIIGDYNTSKTFPGTDCLSMAVQPEFNAMLRRWRSDQARNGYILVFEGDRLCNNPTIDTLNDIQIPWVGYTATADQTLIDARHAARDAQNASWLEGRRTKVKNLTDKYHLTPLVNNTGIDVVVNAQTIMTAVRTLQQRIAQLA